MSRLGAAFRRIFNLEPKIGDTFPGANGGTLTYLGKRDKWADKTCDVCKGPATQYKTIPPWPGTTYSHTDMTCDEHESYLDGMSWQRCADGPWTESDRPDATCIKCDATYGQCEHTAHYAAIIAQQELAAVRGRINP